MYSYKVKYLGASFLGKLSSWRNIDKFDGLTTSRELEALIIEESENGFELVSITPLEGAVISGAALTNATTGFMVTFKKIEER